MSVERLMSIVAHESKNVSIDWNFAEVELGLSLPADFKDLARAFGSGVFGDDLEVYSSVDGNGVPEILGEWRQLRASMDEVPSRELLYEPYALYRPGRGGVLQWGSSDDGESEYFWDVRPGDSVEWAILARDDIINGGWHHFEMTISEFLARAVSDRGFRFFASSDRGASPSFTAW